MPTLYIPIILASVVESNFWWLLGILLLFSWMGFVGVVRAEFLKTQKFEYVRAARALGVSNTRIILRHVLPNALAATITFVPFTLAGSVTILTSSGFSWLWTTSLIGVIRRTAGAGQSQPASTVVGG